MIVMTTELVAWSSTKATTIAATADSRSGVWSSASAVLGTAVAPVRRRLPITFARHVGQQPTYYAQIRGQHGDRYADLTQDPAWAFGEGKSYTTVAYSGLVLDAAELGLGDTVVGRVTLTNTGSRPSRETVQAYIRDEVTSASWADRELKGFTQAWVQPGESVEVEVRVPVAACTIVDASGNRIVEPGEFSLLVGPSSRTTDLLAASFTVG